MKTTRSLALAGIALLGLTACGGDEVETYSAPEPDETAEQATEQPAEGPEAPSDDEDVSGGTAPDEPVDGTYEVGDTFPFHSANNTGTAEITWDAIDWVETDDGQEAAIMAFTIDATDSSEEIQHHYNTSGTSGWYYVDDDMVATSYVDMYTSWDGATYGHDMPGGEFVAPGTVGGERTMMAVTGEDRGGIYAYAEDGIYTINLDIPDEPVNAEDNETLQGVHDQVEELYDGVYFTAW